MAPGATRAGGGMLDWMFQQPGLFVAHLERLGLAALRPRRRGVPGAAGG
jgi:hypothetical protein